MSLQYIIDGYNVIKHSSCSLPGKIKDERAALIEFIKNRRLCGSAKNKITIVFDGSPHVPGPGQHNDEINIIFTRHETADEWIKRAVESTVNPRNVIVVSDDKEIKFVVNSLGAHTMGVEEFCKNKEKLKKQDKKDLLKPELSYSQIDQINRELRKIWLK